MSLRHKASSEATSRRPKQLIRTVEPAAWTVQVFFDGACPLCLREIALLNRLDHKERIWFTDIASADFEATAWGTSYDKLMDRIAARLPSGQWIDGVEVFRRLYGAVGFSFLVPLTRLPLVRQVLDYAYEKFAKNRLRWTGRCDGGTCALPHASGARD